MRLNDKSPGGKRSKMDKTACEECFTCFISGGNPIVLEKSNGGQIASKYFKRVVNDGVC